MANSDEHALLLDVGARLTAMEKSFERAAGVVKSKSKEMEASATSLEKFFGKPSLGKALDKTFDATRFKILDSGVAKVGLMGGALESMGVAGLGAAAAIGAVALALSQAEGAIRFSDELEDTAGKLHVTTDALQEYRYAIRAAGGEEKGADEALESFSETLGKAREGLPKAVKAFEAIGITEAQLKSFKDTDSAIVAVTAKLSALGSTADKDAITAQLGLTGIKQLVQGGVEGLQTFRQEAHAAGVVMSRDLIDRASGLADQIDTINKRIDIDMKSAFIGLGPVILDLKKELAEVLESVLRIIDGFRKIEDRSSITIQSDIAKLQGTREHVAAGYLSVKSPFGGEDKQIRMSAAEQASQLATLDAKIAAKELVLAQRNNEATRRDEGDAANAFWNRGGTSLTPRDKAGGRDKKFPDYAALREALAMQNAMDIAQARGDAEHIQALQDQLYLEKQIKELKAAGITGPAADTLAAAQLKTVQAERAAAEWREHLARLAAQPETATETAASKLARESLSEMRDDKAGEFMSKGLAETAKLAEEARQEWYDSTYDGVLGGLHAVADGNGLQYLGDLLKQKAFESMADGITAALQGAKGGSGFFASAASALGNLFTHHASGTSFAPGGWSMVGENGPELVNMARGGQVIPNHALSNLSVGSRGGGVTVLQPMHFDLRGAVVTQDLLNHMNQIGVQATLAGGQLGEQRALNSLARRQRAAIG